MIFDDKKEIRQRVIIETEEVTTRTVNWEAVSVICIFLFVIFSAINNGNNRRNYQPDRSNYNYTEDEVYQYPPVEEIQ